MNSRQHKARGWKIKVGQSSNTELIDSAPLKDTWPWWFVRMRFKIINVWVEENLHYVRYFVSDCYLKPYSK